MKIVEVMDDALALFRRIIVSQPDALFIGDGPITFGDDVNAVIADRVQEHLDGANDAQKSAACDLARIFLQKGFVSNSFTGVVVAGFGRDDLFPTLISFEIDGIVSDRLKYVQTNCVDIDREGPRAKVIPFAQKEMVERFLYGLDEKIQNNIASFCEDSVTTIREQVLEQLDFSVPQDRDAIRADAIEAEAAFVKGLREKAFEEIRSQSQAEIEGMVEFMPKPELAKMAEALVNLTSIKRRVSRGMETVGGPIDVAVISQSEGFVWVKRKHYFPADLNIRYVDRVHQQLAAQERRNGQNELPGDARGARRRATEGESRYGPEPASTGSDAGDAEGNS